MNDAPIVYKDFWFKIAGSLVVSQVIDSIGREESYFQRFTTKYFYTDLLGGFVIALLLWEIVRFFTRNLDRKYDWMEKPVQRILLQLLLGIVTPSLLSFFFTFAFMKLAHNQDIFETTWPHSEFYTVVLLILLINLVYFTWWLYLKWKEQHNRPASQELPSLRDNNIDEPEAARVHTQNPVIEVSKAGKTILLPKMEIACAYLTNGYCYIKPFAGDGFVTTYTIDEMVRMLDENHFFRVNRQTLISKKSCLGYKSIENGKIELDLDPPLKNPVVVSQKRASEFRKWIAVVVQV